MSPATDYLMTPAQRELVLGLFRSDQETSGRPSLAANQVESARAYLSQLLIDVRAEIAHTRLLEQLYGAPFRSLPARQLWPGEQRPAWSPGVEPRFRHNQPLPDEKARPVAEQGPSALSSAELAALLLNPYALHDLADLLDTTCPDYWLERMRAAGEELIQRYGMKIPIPGLDDQASASS
jgi:hypothetical protein